MANGGGLPSTTSVSLSGGATWSGCGRRLRGASAVATMGDLNRPSNADLNAMCRVVQQLEAKVADLERDALHTFTVGHYNILV